jgi:hypothetical protein
MLSLVSMIVLLHVQLDVKEQRLNEVQSYVEHVSQDVARERLHSKGEDMAFHQIVRMSSLGRASRSLSRQLLQMWSRCWHVRKKLAGTFAATSTLRGSSTLPIRTSSAML